MPDDMKPDLKPDAGGTTATAPHPPFEEVMGHLDHYLRENPEAREALRTHEVVAGIAGEIGERNTKARLVTLQAEEAAKAAEEAIQRQLRLAEEDPEAFAAQFTEETRGKLAARDLQQAAFKERKALASLIGRAIADLPEGKFTQDESAEIATALVGVPDENVIATYTRVTNDIIARKRAERMAADQITERLRTEREAWETEQAAKRVKTASAPTLRSGTAAGTDSDEPDFRKNPQEWNRWYESQRR